MNSKSLVALAAALLATVAGIALLRQHEPLPTDFIYLLDARRDSSKPLEQALPVIKQLELKYSAKVIVRAAASLDQLRDYQAMFEEFDRTRDAIEPLPLFFALDRPFKTTKKGLREAVDNRASLYGASRVQLLERLIVVRDTEKLSKPDECKQLDDDLQYAIWNFLGGGLLVRDGTLQELKNCIAILAPDK